ncbi:Glycosyltransferase involved in cell wall bisynthesis [Butyrivibrio proteoclasticus]|uniref:Glycosyltransferase involved in cell wall bisynthesis n=1 Tax=Butyrivibrio proteoclasticus TaxID=43305 RepID=A0A1I5PVN6_9FIRM|nr:glycosyltransferase [Butyrivibrio proteoclasticus]SFP37890.1 Glycosyltransferase involved in cell wall bisynthesis [Butyrivibrio proteoclasticus]
MTTAVVMCTYNGEKYILEQLESIYTQTKQPDEVIIQDDCSTDKTVATIRNFISEHNLDSNWKLSVNSDNLGWKRNFMSAIKSSSAELIFLSDQDDIWDKDKIRIMSEICSQNSDIELLVSRHEPFENKTGKEAYVYQPSLGKDEVTKVPFSGAFQETLRQGCTYAMKRKLIQYIDDMWDENWPHDQFFWCIAIARGTLYSYNRPLVRHRRHMHVSTPSNDKTREIRSGLAKKSADIAEMLLENKKVLGLSESSVRILEKSKTVNRKRERYISARNVMGIISLLTMLDCYTRFKAWAGDVFVVLRKR